MGDFLFFHQTERKPQWHFCGIQVKTENEQPVNGLEDKGKH